MQSKLVVSSYLMTCRAGKELNKREITIVDRSATEVLLTLWGERANNFDGSGFPVVATKGAKVSDFNGVTLSGGWGRYGNLEPGTDN